MKPEFALSLSFEGITLLHRAAGGWRHVGEVALDTPDLRAALADLRETALRLSPEGITTKLVLPNDQIRYLSVETGSFEGDARLEMARAQLAGATPYEIEELAYDISPDGRMTHVAAVAQETLDEAEAFANEHRFAPLCFVANPGEEAFLGEPFFGETACARDITGGAEVEPDGIAVVVVGPAEFPDETSDEPETPEVADPAAEDAAESTPAAGFSSRRQKSPEGGETPAPATPVTAEQPRITLAPAEADVLLDEAETESAVARAAVTDPGIAVPEFETADEETPGTEESTETPDASFGALLGQRRRREAPRAPRPVAAEAVAHTEAPPLPDGQTPRDETDRMTVFGARRPGEVGGKPKRLGLMLTAALLLALAAVAAWASLFLDDGLAGIFGPRDDSSEFAMSPAPAPTVQDTDPVAMAAPDGAATPAMPETGDQPAATAPALSDTDVAVLDALSATPDDAIPETSEESAPELTDEMLADETVAEEEAMDLAALPEEELGDFEPGDETDLMARYAATGIWPEAPETLESPAIVGIDDVFVASIDRTDMAQDAVALPPDSGFATDNAPTILSSPAAHGTDFELDPRGLVAASAEGTLNPDGVMIYAGRPPLAPATIPARVDVPAETVEARNRLATLRPRARPEDLQEQAERNQLGGLTRTELATLRPRLRPQSEQEQELQEQAEPGLPPTKQAVAASPRPGARPSDFASIVQQTVASVPSVSAQPDTSAGQSDAGDDEPEPEQTAAAATVQPSIPTAASVARQATQDGAINLNKVNLIGVYGTSSDRRALVRLPSGRYKKVQVGDTVDGGRVVAIGDSELRYQKKGRNMTLKIPSG